jgi:hypothetical protein
MIARLLFIVAFIGGIFALSPASAADDVAAASRSVVRVVTVAIVDGQVVGYGHGSGFAISPTRIVTNAHVVAPAVRYPDNVAIGAVPSQGSGAVLADIVAVDEDHDLAIIEIRKGTIPPTAIYTGPVEAGMKVSALGYPGNVDAAAARGLFERTEPRAAVRTDGTVSSPDDVRGTQVLSHTAPIARGNSGGPLVDECGRVIGVNTFITRADDGDAPFAFAVQASELTKFLADNGQKVATVGTACVPIDKAEDMARDRAQTAKEAEAAARLAQAEEAAKARETRLLRLQGERENRMALAAVLLVLGALGAGAALVFMQQDKSRTAKIAGGVGAALILAAMLAFFSRPALDLSPQPFDTGDEANAEDAAAEGNTEKAVTPAAVPLAKTGRAFTCVIDLEASRVTVSQTSDVPIAIDAKGCVNGRTQYADMGKGDWQRVLVPQQDAAVSVATFNPDAKRYTVERYLLAADKMEEARTLRKAVTLKQCSSDAAQVLKLGDTQTAVTAILPDAPNERLIYKCAAGR